MTLLEEIKEKIDIAEFIGSYIALKPAGKNLKALCPFHQEKTPSFIVSPERQMWHCFGGCGIGGDIFKFLMLYENLEFHEALRVLAEKAGIEMQRLNLQDQKEFNTCYELQEKAKNFFKEELSRSAPSNAYLQKRCLTEQTITEFELGFAPTANDNLILRLVHLGYNINEIVKAGLAVKTETGKCVDRFRGRIMFPIYNQFGKIVGFTGRILPEWETANTGKYVNSPETLIFNKSRVLYGFHKSKTEINRSRAAFLVEGQMDFLMSWQTDVKNTVAVSGTALGPEQLKILRRAADNLIVSFDQDSAGIKALERSLEFLNKFDFNISIIDLKNYKDPAEAAAANPDFFRKTIGQTQPVFTRLFDFYLKNITDWSIKKNNLRHLLQIIKNLASPLEQTHWLKELAIKSEIEEKILLQELAAIKNKNKPTTEAETAPPPKSSRLDLICRKLLSLSFFKPELQPLLTQEKEYLPTQWQQILDTILSTEKTEKNETISFLDLYSAYEFSASDATELAKEFQELLRQLKIEFLKNQSRQTQTAIKSAHTTQNNDLEQELLKKFQLNSQEINALQNK